MIFNRVGGGGGERYSLLRVQVEEPATVGGIIVARALTPPYEEYSQSVSASQSVTFRILRLTEYEIVSGSDYFELEPASITIGYYGDFTINVQTKYSTLTVTTQVTAMVGHDVRVNDEPIYGQSVYGISYSEEMPSTRTITFRLPAKSVYYVGCDYNGALPGWSYYYLDAREYGVYTIDMEHRHNAFYPPTFTMFVR